MNPPGDQAYKTRLGDVLRRRDPELLHLFLRQQAAGYGDEQQVADVELRSHEEMEELMHRMTLARTDLADLHDESRDWLAARGRLDRSARPAPETRRRPPGGSRPSGRGRSNRPGRRARGQR